MFVWKIKQFWYCQLNWQNKSDTWWMLCRLSGSDKKKQLEILSEVINEFGTHQLHYIMKQ